ncbi:MAG: zinc ribbon domain-containing protein [Clostridia bacterium]|nr:zinc ribbon domain-containing protein [Clostridia bacterium]
MRCINCGFDFPDNTEFCPNCGCAAPKPQGNSFFNAASSAAETVTNVLRDPLFLVICILISASTVIGLLNNTFNIFNILYAIFLWLVYFNSKKEAVDSKLLRNLSGMVFAVFIFNFVIIGIFFLAGITVAAAINLVGSDPELLNQVLNYIGEFDPASIDAFKDLLSLSGFFFFSVFTVLMALSGVLNFFSYKKIHNFAKSVADSVQNGVLDLKSITATKVWLIIFAIAEAINIFECRSAFDVASLVCAALAPIFAFCLVNKLEKSAKPGL